MAEPLQVWVRNDKGKVWGPLMPTTLELLFENQLIPGRVQVSLDGDNYVYPARMPEVRDHIPQELWGDAAAVPARAPAAAPAPAAAAASVIPGGPPSLKAGPGAVAHAQQKSTVPGEDFVARAASARRTVSADMGSPAPSGPRSAASAVAAAAAQEMSELPAKGDLGTAGPLRLYYLAASSEASGLLHLELSDRGIDIHFRKGNPELIESDHPEDALSAMLLKQGLASAAQLQQAEGEKARFGGELVPALFGLAILNPGTAFQHLQTRAASILGKALVASHGRFTFVTEELAPSRAMPLGHKWALAAEQVRRIPAPELRRRLADAFDLPVMKSGGRVPLGELRLTPQETRAASYFDGVRSLSQMIADLPGEADTIVRVAFFLKEVDAISFAGVRLQPREVEAEPELEAEIEGALDDDAAAAAPTPPEAPAPAAARAPPKLSAPGPGPGARPSQSQIPGGPPKMAAPAGGPVAGPGARPSQIPGGPPKMGAAPSGGPMAGPGARPAAAPARPAAPAAPAQAPRVPPTTQPGVGTKVVQKIAPGGAAPAAAAPVLGDTNDVNVLRPMAEKVRGQNLLEVLGLKKDTNAAQVKAAYFKMAKSFHPDTVPPGCPEEVGRLKAEIFGKIGEANRTLSDDAMRAEYIAEVEAGGQGEKIDVAAILAAEEQFQKGEILVKARKFPEAVKMLDEAIKSNAEGEYLCLRGYAKFFTYPDKKTGYQEAMKDINAGLHKNPRVANAFYFQGHIAKLTGDLISAKKFFTQCLQMNPQHLEAQRELRMMK